MQKPKVKIQPYRTTFGEIIFKIVIEIGVEAFEGNVFRKAGWARRRAKAIATRMRGSYVEELNAEE